MHAFLIYDVTQILYLAHVKGAFLQVGTQFVLLRGLKEFLNVLQVLLPTLNEGEDFIQIKNHERVGEGLQYVIHQPHKSSRDIYQPEGHDQPFKNASLGFEGGHPYIYGLYWNLVVTRLQIDLAEILGPIELVQQVINLWDWMPVPKSKFV